MSRFLIVCFLATSLSCGKGSVYDLFDEDSEEIQQASFVEEILLSQEVLLFCNISNYKEFVQDHNKILELIEQTGEACQLQGADFTGEDLSNYDFSYADLTSARFKEANLTYTNFTGATLIDTDFTGATLIYTIFVKAVAKWANFQQTDLYQADFEDTMLDQTTYSPSYKRVPDLLDIRSYWNDYGIKDPESRGMIATETTTILKSEGEAYDIKDPESIGMTPITESSEGYGVYDEAYP